MKKRLFMMALICFSMTLNANSNCYILHDKNNTVIYQNSEPPFSLAYSESDGHSQDYLQSQQRGEILQIIYNECTGYLYPDMEVDTVDSGQGYVEIISDSEPDTCPTNAYVIRDEDGKIARSLSAKHDFQYQQPCPSTGLSTGGCPGYIIDHIKPLACGGQDAPCNMQWQTVIDAKEKDKYERDNCELNATKTNKTKTVVHYNHRYSQPYSSGGSYSGFSRGVIQTGPRGGRFYINSNGNRQYIKH